MHALSRRPMPVHTLQSLSLCLSLSLSQSMRQGRTGIRILSLGYQFVRTFVAAIQVVGWVGSQQERLDEERREKTRYGEKRSVNRHADHTYLGTYIGYCTKIMFITHENNESGMKRSM